MPVKNRFAELLTEITAWRRDFHEHPELLFDVHRTAARVADLLREFGCDEVVEGIGRTGVVAVIRGKTDTAGRAIGLRADMDALPIHEATGAEHASKTPGKMHACGHDGHTSMLLGAAKYLAETRNFDGTAVMIFQPAEEGGGGGREMVQDGMLDRWKIDEVYGMHNMPGIPVGTFAIRPGAMMAAATRRWCIIRPMISTMPRFRSGRAGMPGWRKLGCRRRKGGERRASGGSIWAKLKRVCDGGISAGGADRSAAYLHSGDGDGAVRNAPGAGNIRDNGGICGGDQGDGGQSGPVQRLSGGGAVLGLVARGAGGRRARGRVFPDLGAAGGNL